MADLSTEDRIKLAVQFIAQSPPGEVNDVIQDIAAIIGDNDALTPHVAAALKEYNLSQMTVVEHAAGDVPAHVTLLSDAHVLPGSEERYIDPVGKRSFEFDHVRLVPSNYAPYVLPAADEEFRAALAASLNAYAKNHFVEGCASVSTNQIPEQPEAQAAPAEAAVAAATAPTPLETPNSGLMEEHSTPGATTRAEDEVDMPGGVEKLDEEMETLEKETEEEQAAEEEAKVEKAIAAEDAEEVVGDKLEDPTAEEVETAAAEAADIPADLEEAGSGLKEEVPSPGEPTDTRAGADDEVDAPGGVEKLDAEIEALAVEETEAPVEASPAPLENPLFVLEIVGNRYKASSFWTGRWRTRWTVDRAAGTVEGELHVDVHYYEQGNVQLATTHRASFPCPASENGQSIASQIVTAIAKVETNYQLEMNDVYEHMGGNAFRSLRRALPVTRQKLDWDKVQGYALGADLSRARA